MSTLISLLKYVNYVKSTADELSSVIISQRVMSKHFTLNHSKHQWRFCKQIQKCWWIIDFNSFIIIEITIIDSCISIMLDCALKVFLKYVSNE